MAERKCGKIKTFLKDTGLNKISDSDSDKLSYLEAPIIEEEIKKNVKRNTGWKKTRWLDNIIL